MGLVLTVGRVSVRTTPFGSMFLVRFDKVALLVIKLGKSLKEKRGSQENGAGANARTVGHWWDIEMPADLLFIHLIIIQAQTLRRSLNLPRVGPTINGTFGTGFLGERQAMQGETMSASKLRQRVFFV